MPTPNQQTNPDLVQSPAWRKIMAFYRTLKLGLWLMKVPLVGGLVQRAWIREGEEANWFIPDGSSIEIGTDIPTGRQVMLPGVVVEDFLDEADGIFAMAACPCRTAFECQSHPREIGCLHLGPATKGIPQEVGRRLTLEEGKAVLGHALAEGLMPTILHMPSEAEIFEVDKTQMLSICFCCECCCDVRLLLRKVRTGIGTCTTSACRVWRWSSAMTVRAAVNALKPATAANV